jgi:hypothetical protein
VVGSENQGPTFQNHTFPNFGWSRARLIYLYKIIFEKCPNDKISIFPDYLKTPYFPKFWQDAKDWKYVF